MNGLKRCRYCGRPFYPYIFDGMEADICGPCAEDMLDELDNDEDYE
jgi:hypothetical protein